MNMRVIGMLAVLSLKFIVPFLQVCYLVNNIYRFIGKSHSQFSLFITDKSMVFYIIVKMIFLSFGSGNLLMMIIYIIYGKYTDNYISSNVFSVDF